MQNELTVCLNQARSIKDFKDEMKLRRAEGEKSYLKRRGRKTLEGARDCGYVSDLSDEHEVTTIVNFNIFEYEKARLLYTSLNKDIMIVFRKYVYIYS